MEREGKRYGNPLFIRGKTAVERLTQKLELAGGTERNGRKVRPNAIYTRPVMGA